MSTAFIYTAIVFITSQDGSSGMGDLHAPRAPGCVAATACAFLPQYTSISTRSVICFRSTLRESMYDGVGLYLSVSFPHLLLRVLVGSLHFAHYRLPASLAALRTFAEHLGSSTSQH